jgi:hypothetical protein
MNLRRSVFIAACMVPFATGQAAAQFQPAPQQRAPQQQAPQQAQQEQQAPPCVQEFMRLRSDAEKKAAAIRQASSRKASPKEACGLFNAFSASEAKMLKYAEDNSVWCGIPPQIVDSIKTGHTRTNEMRTKICNVAAQAPMAPRGPSLSDALGSPVPDTNNIKTGRGTFDTLTGTPLGNK